MDAHSASSSSDDDADDGNTPLLQSVAGAAGSSSSSSSGMAADSAEQQQPHRRSRPTTHPVLATLNPAFEGDADTGTGEHRAAAPGQLSSAAGVVFGTNSLGDTSVTDIGVDVEDAVEAAHVAESEE
jgi:hypothetical protein